MENSETPSHHLKEEVTVKALTSPCGVVGGNWRTQDAHEILRRGKMVGLIRRHGIISGWCWEVTRFTLHTVKEKASK